LAGVLSFVLLPISMSAIAQASPAQAGTQSNQPGHSANIHDPAPDTSNFPNSANTLPKGRLYIENSPLGLLLAPPGESNEYQWSFLIRYGLTDRIELRTFSNGLTVRGQPDEKTGFSPLAFDVKVHLLDQKKDYLPSLGVEAFILTRLGTEAFVSGTAPSVNALFTHTLPKRFKVEYNFGITREFIPSGEKVYRFSFPWAVTQNIVEDFEIFVQGFIGSATLRRFQRERTDFIQETNAAGAGVMWTVHSRVAIWSSYSFGFSKVSPDILNVGFAVAF
jgi:hypothetical protein